MQNTQNCCAPSGNQKNSALIGALYGLIPHIFCLLFIFASTIGALGATTFAKKALLIPHIFPIMLGASLFFATLSAVFYLEKNAKLCCAGLLEKWKYLATLCIATIGINAFIILFVFPTTINATAPDNFLQTEKLSTITVKVGIPCSGHAALIIDELSKLAGIGSVTFKMPNVFKITYDNTSLSSEEIERAEIFKTFKLINFK